MGWRIKFTNIRQLMLKLKTHFGFHDLFPSTNTVVYFHWKTVIYIYVAHKSVTFTGACANEIIPSINRSFVYKAIEGRHVRIQVQPKLVWE